MTLQEMTIIVAPVAFAYRVDADDVTFRAYHRVLKDVPPGLLEAGILLLVDAGQRFFPTAVELQQGAELARRHLVAAHPYDGCSECEDQRGYRSILGAHGQKTVEPCPCKARHAARLEQLGLRAAVARVPSEAGPGEDTVYPALAHLPAGLREKLQSIALQKTLR